MDYENGLFQMIGGTLDEWTRINPVLPDRVMAYETDTRRFKVGNGIASYASLPYAMDWVMEANGDASDTTVTYTEPDERVEPVSGGKLSEIIGRVAKWVRGLTAADVGASPTSHASTGTTYGAASASNYGHAMASGTTPKAGGTAAIGSETAKFARGDHVHPAQTAVTGNAGTATKLATARTIGINGAVTGTATGFDGSGNVTIPTTAVDATKLDGIIPKANLDLISTDVFAPTTLVSGTDLNTIRTPGLYWATTSDAATLINCPTTTYFGMRVYQISTPGTGRVIQFIDPYASGTEMYWRKVTNDTTAQEWQTFITSAFFDVSKVTDGILAPKNGGTGNANGTVQSLTMAYISSTTLPSLDLNDVTASGTYGASTSVASTLANCPVTVGFSMRVWQNANTATYWYQELTPYSNTYATTNKKWWRVRASSTTWSPWYYDLTSAQTVSIPEGGTGGTTQQSAAMGLGVPSLMRPSEYPIASGDDLDNYKTPGMYLSGTASVSSSLANCPFTSGGLILQVAQGSASSTGSHLLQTIYPNIGTGITFTRRWYSGAWNEWYRHGPRTFGYFTIGSVPPNTIVEQTITFPEGAGSANTVIATPRMSTAGQKAYCKIASRGSGTFTVAVWHDNTANASVGVDWIAGYGDKTAAS